jgi:Na+(H+)/acetate symporter ActP
MKNKKWIIAGIIGFIVIILLWIFLSKKEKKQYYIPDGNGNGNGNGVPSCIDGTPLTNPNYMKISKTVSMYVFDFYNHQTGIAGHFTSSMNKEPLWGHFDYLRDKGILNDIQRHCAIIQLQQI